MYNNRVIPLAPLIKAFLVILKMLLYPKYKIIKHTPVKHRIDISKAAILTKAQVRHFSIIAPGHFCRFK